MLSVTRLELQGFKSFKDRSVIHFDTGITGVIGPNGCGKSNIVEAFLWVLGEQSAKSLRSSKMEDVIFHGSSRYQAVGFAEVALTLLREKTNADGTTISDEIQISRKLYRSGESEYSINKISCRLKDIQDLFLDSGVGGSKTYSIIRQGQVHDLISMKPEDRRIFIEEVAGIGKFKIRKKESLRKLESATNNLLRLNDILLEIDRQLKSLDRQAAKARQYKRYKDELKDKDIRIASIKHSRFKKRILELTEKLHNVNMELDQIKAGVSTEELAIEEKRIYQIELQREVEVFTEKQSELIKDLQKNDSQKTHSNSNLQDNKKNQIIFAEKIDKLDGQIAEYKEEYYKNDEEFKAIEEEFNDSNTQMKLLEQNVEKAKNALAQLENQLNSTKSNQMGLLQKEGSLNNSLSSIKGKLDHYEPLRVKLEEDYNAKKAQYEIEERMIESTEEELETWKQVKEEKSKSRSELQEKIEINKREFSEEKKKFDSINAQRASINSKLETFEQLLNQYEGFKGSVKDFLKLSKTANFASDIKGVIADYLDVKSGYENYVETAIADLLEIVVLSDVSKIDEALKLLKEKKLAKLSIAAITDKAFASENDSLTAEKLINSVTLKSNCPTFIKRKLENTYITNDIQEAISLAQKSKYSAFVTKQNDYVDELGVITSGGAEKNAETSFLARKNKVQELKKEIEEIKLQAEVSEEKLNDLELSKEDLELALKKCIESLHEAEVQFKTIAQKKENAERNLKNIEDTIRGLEREKQNTLTECERLNSEKQKLEEELSKVNAERDSFSSKISAIESEYPVYKEAFDKAQTDMNEFRVREAQVKEKLHSIKQAQLKLSQTLKTFQDEKTFAERSLEHAKEQEEELRQSIIFAEESIKNLTENLAMLEKKLSEKKKTYENLNTEVYELENSMKDKRSNFESFREQIMNFNLELEKLQSNDSFLVQNIYEHYQIEIPDFGGIEKAEEITVASDIDNQEQSTETITSEIEGDDNSDSDEQVESMEEEEKQASKRKPKKPIEQMTETELESDISKLKEKIHRLGTVNIMAIEEYEQLSVRKENLSSQKFDLEKSINDLKSAIDKINKTTKERFVTAFAEINNKFSNIYPALFGGGQARLSMTDENNPLETGIDIMAQPPGKKNQSITLLSGGEQALTAVSLIFSVFLLKPSPFCLLDEVDAPLDDANVSKFNALLKEMSKKSQFIIITHNKRTMELNDKLYGVTMEEPGVSKMVSIKLS